MLIVKILTILSVLCIALFSINVNTYAELEATFWAPEEALLREEYFAAIILDSNTNSDITFDIVTDNEEILQVLTEQITVVKGMHHGLVKFETTGTGNAKLYAIANGLLLEKNINIVESADNPTSLDLILPSDLANVLVDENIHTGYVFLLNDFENTVAAKTPISIVLTSNGDIELPTKSVTIEPEKHYAKFQFKASGEGSISASAQNLLPDEESISLDDLEEIELVVAVGPDPIPTSSTAEIYFWLERGGKPYLPPHDVEIAISIDKSTNLSFDSAMRGAFVLSDSITDIFGRETPSDVKRILTKTSGELNRDSRETFVIKKGEYYGKLQAYSSFDPINNIKISGTAESINANEDDEELIKVSEVFTTNTESSSSEPATETDIFAYPDPAYKEVEIIISSIGERGPIIEDDDGDFVLFLDNKLQLIPEQQTKIKEDENYVVVKAKVLDFGTSKIFAQMHEADSKEIETETSGKYVKDPELDIVALPVLFNTEQDLFLISSSQDKIVTNPDEEGNLISITSRPTFDFEVNRASESVLAVTGSISEILEDDPEVHVSSNAFTVEDTLEIYNPERKKLNSMHPTFVYPKEPFPIVKHMNDLNENPVKKAELNVSSDVDIGNLNDELYVFNQTGTHDIIFYDKNSVPIKSAITVKGLSSTVRNSEPLEDTRSSTFNYEIIVHEGSGSGIYEEGEDITISAQSTKDDVILLKKKLIGWENLPYKEPTVSFEADDDLETRPIYQDDFSILYLVIGAVGVSGSFVVIKRKKKGNTEDKKINSEEDDLMDLLKD